MELYASILAMVLIYSEMPYIERFSVSEFAQNISNVCMIFLNL